MAEKQNTPEIRFEGFTDPWEQRKLGDCFEFLKNNTLSRADLNGENGTARNVHYGDILIKFGDCLDGERSDLPFITDDTVLPKFAGSILREGDVIFADTAEDEAAGKCVELRKLPKEPTISGLHTIPARPRSPFGTGYLGHYLNSDAYHRQLLPLMQGIKVISVSKAALQDTQVRFPGLSEQTAIGAALSEIDNLITLHQRKYDKLCTVKKSMLDKMFPKLGETEPEIRFDGFTDPWEQRKLGSIAASFDYGLNAAATEYDGQNKYLRITDIDDTTHEFLKSDLTTPLADLAMSADYLLEEGDLLFARTGASVGKTYLYRQYDGTVYFAGFLIRARIGESADPEFVYQATLTDAYKKYVAITSQRSGQPGVNAQEYADYQLMLPSRTEQQQIGMTLRSLDNLITLHQRKLELLRNIKKSLLDRMFV